MSAGPTSISETVNISRTLTLGSVEEIPVGEGRAFDVDGAQVAVFRMRNGQVHAVSAVCPHRGGPIADGQSDGTVVLCPLHLNAFDLSTGCSTTGAAPLEVWPVTVDEGGQIVIGTQPQVNP
jgi:nitrite reductase/ring-hydroxylating ferredoxin subunit